MDTNKMDAVRCPECGDVRWSFFGFAARSAPQTCELCGTEMIPERRRPIGMRPAAAAVERRDEAVASAPPPPAAPAV